MDHKLAKKLKDNGFPQEGIDWYCPFCKTYWDDGGLEGGACNIYGCKGWNNKYTEKDHDAEIYDKAQISIPTLKKLIEACDEGFGLDKDLNRVTEVYEYTTDTIYHHPRKWFKTPEEAVARLWLKLNKK